MVNEKKLFLKLQNRDKEAFREFYYEYYKLVYYQAYSILNNKEDAEDVSQQTFIKFMRNIEDISLNASLKTIITHLAKNEAIDLYRKNRRSKEVHDDEVMNFMSYQASDKDLTIDLIYQLLKSNVDAKIVILKVLYDYSFQDIADDLELSLGKVQGRYYKAIEVLKKYYEEVN